MHRFVVAIALLAFACGSRKAQGPAWPAPSTTAEDGGESLEPRPTATYAAAIEKSDDKAEEKTATPASDDKPAAETKTEDKPATSSEPGPTLEEILMTEEIVIEIEE